MTDIDIDPASLKNLSKLQASIDRLVGEFEAAVGAETPTDLERRMRVLTACFKLQDVLTEKAKSEVEGVPEPTSFLNMIPPNDEEIAQMRAELIRRYDRLAAANGQTPSDQ